MSRPFSAWQPPPVQDIRPPGPSLAEQHVHAPERFVAPEQGDGFEDPRRDRGARDSNADGLKDVLRLDAAVLDDAPQRALDRRLVPGLELGERAPHLTQAVGRTVTPEDALAGGVVVDRAVVDEAGERPEGRERLDLLARDRDAISEPGAARVALDACRELVQAQLAEVDAVH